MGSSWNEAGGGEKDQQVDSSSLTSWLVLGERQSGDGDCCEEMEGVLGLDEDGLDVCVSVRRLTVFRRPARCEYP